MRVLKPLCLLSGVLMLLLTGCANINLPFELSNQYQIEKTIDDVNIGALSGKTIPPKAIVVLQSLEKIHVQEHPLIAMVEDQMIQSLMKSGFTVLERDNDGLISVIQESQSNGFQLYQSQGSSDDKGSPLVRTSLSTADYLINYRIQECGVSYQKKPLNSNYIRTVLIRLHLRICDAKTGKVLIATNQLTTKSDEIPAKVKRMLKQADYSRYNSYSYPAQK